LVLQRTCALVALIFLLSVQAGAETYPSKYIRFIAPSTPGGGVDFIARTIGDRLSKRLNQPVVVENRPGTDMIVPAKELIRSAPDGYTLMLGYSSMVTSPLLNPNATYRPLEDFTAICVIGYIPLLVDVNPSVPARTLQELVNLARSKPGALRYAMGGTGSSGHIGAELLKYRAKIDLQRVPYRGAAEALTSVMADQNQVMFDTVTTSLPQVKAGTLRALAVTSAKRSTLAPNIPTVAEQGFPGFDVSAWYIVLAPANTPKPIVDKLNAEIQAVLDDPNVKARLLQGGVDIVGGSADQATQFVTDEQARWTGLLKSGAVSSN
jgi:tripartite-type tricarboxylate transporter receptor subunit TctC